MGRRVFKKFRRNLASVYKPLAEFAGIFVVAGLATLIVTMPGFGVYYYVHGIGPVELLTMEPSESVGLTTPVLVAEAVWLFVVLPVVWAAGKAVIDTKRWGTGR